MGIEDRVDGDERGSGQNSSNQQYGSAVPSDQHEYLLPLQLEQHWERVHQYQRNVLNEQEEED